MGGRGKKIAAAVRVALLSPEKLGRSCEDCEKYLYDETTGEPKTMRGRELPVLRPTGTEPPCMYCAKTLGQRVRVRANATDPGRQASRAFRHYRECRAVGRFPDDPIVKRHADVIRAVYDAVESGRAESFLAIFGAKRRG